MPVPVLVPVGVAKVDGEGVAPLLMKGLAPGNSARLAWRSPSRSRNRVGGTVEEPAACPEAEWAVKHSRRRRITRLRTHHSSCNE